MMNKQEKSDLAVLRHNLKTSNENWCRQDQYIKCLKHECKTLRRLVAHLTSKEVKEIHNIDQKNFSITRWNEAGI